MQLDTISVTKLVADIKTKMNNIYELHNKLSSEIDSLARIVESYSDFLKKREENVQE